jgi:hypothetical protein
MKVKTACQNCKKNFKVERAELTRGWGKFCSLSCSASYNNLRGRGGPKPKGKNVNCKVCGKVVYRILSVIKRYKNFFCSRECQIKSRTTSGRSQSLNQVQRQKLYYKYQKICKNVKKERGDKCQICGWDKATCDTHHIQPVANGGKNIPSNIIILCPNDHRLARDGILTQKKLRAHIKK